MQQDKQPMNRVVAAVRVDEATADDAPAESPEVEIQEDESPPVDVERDEISLDGIECPDDMARALVEEVSHYEWDTLDDGEDIPLYKAYKVDAPETGCLKLTHVGITHYVMPPVHGPVHEHHVDTCLCAGVKAEGNPPLYDHRVRKRPMNQPSHPREGNHTLSGFWEVHGVRAHCLLDSGCEGVMASSNFAWATGMAMFWLDQPISLQLACIGSKSMINYSARTVIKFGNTTVEETFNITNINYYDVILGTPFLRCLGVILDFNGPGHI